MLFIGNSYTRFNDLPRQVELVSRSVEGGPHVDASRETHGGFNLRRHWRRRRVRHLVERGGFDAVVLQGHSLSPLDHPDELAEYARRFHDRAEEAGARLVLFETWPRHPRSRLYRRRGDLRGPDEMLARVGAVYRALGRELDAPVAPVGHAWRAALDALPEAPLHRRDGTHPTLAGSYLSACVVYGTLSGRDPREAAWNPWNLDDAHAERIRALAAEALVRRRALPAR
ncbi:MAG TPA: hypothetical protein RMH99_17720 [Sandaracinaceae bacterium LLY-WYZ-13_1]|nr:hypothetical protein [Sandaracinaceae bacterium LLY-WYZ-13_1]